MGNFRLFFKNIFGVFISNTVSLIAGLLLGILLPKLLDIDDFGWYRTFTLYSSYVGFFSFGIIDGIVLQYSDKNYDELPIRLFRSYFSWYTIINCAFVIILMSLGLILPDNNKKFIIISTGLYGFLINISGYFQQISQITQRFKEFSFRKILSSCLKVLCVLVLVVADYFWNITNYRFFITLLIISEFILMGWYLYTYRDIVFGLKESLYSTKRNVLRLSVKGFPLLFANLCSSLILSIDIQIVNLLFSTEIFAKYSFAYNLLTLVSIATSAFSVVLFPTLARMNRISLRKNYQLMSEVVLSIFMLSNFLYFPLSIFIEWYLPKYFDSLQFLRIILPGLPLTNLITVLIHNYYKIEGLTLVYFRKSLVVLILSMAGNLFAFYFFGNPVSISISSVVMILYWYIDVENYFVKNYSYTRWKNLVFVLVNMLSFYLLTSISNQMIGMLTYFLLYFALINILYKDSIKSSRNLFTN
ncbi:TPA: lipopolysaccharide biosynthesis protein [Streptococcus suis]